MGESVVSQLSKPDARTRAMNAIFELSSAMTEGRLSILDLKEVIRLTVAKGHKMLAMHLTVALAAVRQVAEEAPK